MNRRADASRQRGFVLVVVLVVIAILALGAYTFSELMVSHREAALLSGKQLQARALVDSAAEALKVFLQLDAATQLDSGGLYDNPSFFRGVVVIDDPEPRDRGSFTLIAPQLNDEGIYEGIRYGLEDESARLNLNSLLVVDEYKSLYPNAARQLLMALPSMSEDVADAILDWIDEDDEPREYGAEVDYYSGLDPAYAPKNSPFETVEELLLVRGVTPQMLFGLDVNRNGIIDTNEQGQALPDGVDNSDGSMNRGWSAYLTLFSMEANKNSSGLQRIDLNGDDLEKLHTDLSSVFSQEWANFIVLYRQNPPASVAGQQVTVAGQGQSQTAATVTMDFTKPAKGKLNQVLDLIDATVQVSGGGQGTKSIKSPFSSDLGAMAIYLPTLLDNVSVNPGPMIPGRININQAPATLLKGIPGITEEVINEIISRRTPVPDPDNPNRQFETWLLTEGIVTLTEMKALSPFICAGGDVHRAQIVGYFQGGGAAARAEVIYDATNQPPRLLLWRDISHLGRGYSPETLGVDFSQ